jgi:hypothetical protein
MTLTEPLCTKLNNRLIYFCEYLVYQTLSKSDTNYTKKRAKFQLCLEVKYNVHLIDFREMNNYPTKWPGDIVYELNQKLVAEFGIYGYKFSNNPK